MSALSTVKRSHSATPDTPDLITPPNSDTDDIKIPPKKSKANPKSPKSPSKSPKKNKDSEAGDKRTRTLWSTEEEAIFCDLAGEVLRDHLWNKVKEDGRLAGRGNTGIKVHAAAIIHKMKKAPQSQ